MYILAQNTHTHYEIDIDITLDCVAGYRYTVELAGWFSRLFDEDIEPHAFFDRIWDGTLLCAFARKISDAEMEWAVREVEQGADRSVVEKVKQLGTTRSGERNCFQAIF